VYPRRLRRRPVRRQPLRRQPLRRQPVRAFLALLAVTAAAGCGAVADAAPGASTGRLDVVVGLYPYQFVAERVGGPDVVVRNLAAPGTEPHDVELTARQLAAISRADLVVYSRGFQPAVDTAVDQEAPGRALDVMSTVDLLAGGGRGNTGPPDPHIWLDPTRLATVAGAVADRLAQRRPDRSQALHARATDLTAELQALDRQLRAGLSSCARTDLVSSHAAFGYLADRYGLHQIAISGLSPDAEPPAGRLAQVARLSRDRGVSTVYFERLVSPKTAQALAREVGAQAVVLDPLEGQPAGDDYLGGMRQDLAALRTGLGCQ